jgi:phage terminase small subunit
VNPEEDKSGIEPSPKPSDSQVESGIPEELDPVWTDKVASAYRALEPRQRVFILAYVRTWNGAEAYRQAYNNLASDQVAANSASRLLAKVGMKDILEAFLETQTEDLLLVKRTYTEAARTATKPIFGKDEEGQPILVLEQADHDVRIKAAQALAKLHGLNAAEKQDLKVSGTIIIQSSPLDEGL